MKPVHILVDSLADAELTNAQMTNAREIISRLNSQVFSVSMFVHGVPATEIRGRPNTRLIQLPDRRQTIPLFSEFMFGKQDIIFYLKAAPAAQWFMKLRSLRLKRCITVGTIESQTDWRDETMTPQAIRLIEQTILRCDYLFSNSEFVRRSLEKNYGRQSVVVPTGVDVEFFTPDQDRLPNARPRVLFAGSLRAFKGPQVILDAAERYPQADFVLVGDGILNGELRERSKALSNVVMRGALPREKVREEYRAADIFMFPSRWEGSPKVLMEAAACALPVLARKDYEPESVIDGQTGLLTSTDTGMIEQLGRLLANADLCRQMGEAGRSHMASFSWNVITRHWEDFFARLAHERARN